MVDLKTSFSPMDFPELIGVLGDVVKYDPLCVKSLQPSQHHPSAGGGGAGVPLSRRYAAHQCKTISDAPGTAPADFPSRVQGGTRRSAWSHMVMANVESPGGVDSVLRPLKSAKGCLLSHSGSHQNGEESSSNSFGKFSCCSMRGALLLVDWICKSRVAPF